MDVGLFWVVSGGITSKTLFEHSTFISCLSIYRIATLLDSTLLYSTLLYSRKKYFWKYFDLKDTIRAWTRIILQKMRWKTTPSRSCKFIGFNGSVIAFSRKQSYFWLQGVPLLIFHASLLHEWDQNRRSSRRCQWRLTAKRSSNLGTT